MIYFATSNKSKFREVKSVFSKEGIEVKHLKICYAEIQANSLKEVVEFGIEFLKKLNKKIFIEDSGLFVHSLNNFPGVYSSYVFKTIGYEGILKLLEDKKNREAHFETMIAYYNLKKIKFFNGICEGRISLIAKGKNGFGYDPIFIPKNANKTFGEMGIEEKNRYSHRGKALGLFVKELRRNFHED